MATITTTTTTTRQITRLTPAALHRKQNHEEWKETLRKACFSRARKNRRDLLWKKRRQHPQGDAPDASAVRSAVEQELRQQGIAVVGPGLTSNPQSSSEPMHLIPMEPETSKEETMEDTDDRFALSEEELYELLQEVEEEMQFLSEEELLEEVLDQEREEMEQQIAQYEDWQESHDNYNPEECVVCPICWESDLQQHPQSSSVYCPNETCAFRLEGNTINLADLKERLRLAFEEHSFQCCGALTFELRSVSGEENMEEKYHLVGCCQQSDVALRIV